MMQEEQKARNEVFHFLEQLNIKAGETLKESLFKAGANRPSFVITDKIDGTFTLYEVEGNKLKKVKTATDIKLLTDYAWNQMN